MPSPTPKLKLPTLADAQSGAETLVTDGRNLIDVFTHLAVESRSATSPPDPEDVENGQAWIVPDGATGDWENQDGRLAIWHDGWLKQREPEGSETDFHHLHEGMRFWVKDERLLFIFDGERHLPMGTQTLMVDNTKRTIDDGTGFEHLTGVTIPANTLIGPAVLHVQASLPRTAGSNNTGVRLVLGGTTLATANAGGNFGGTLAGHITPNGGSVGNQGIHLVYDIASVVEGSAIDMSEPRLLEIQVDRNGNTLEFVQASVALLGAPEAIGT